MANLNVWKHLNFYPKDSGPVLSEACEGSRWLHNLPPKLMTPWIRLGGKDGQDYSTFEPTLTQDNQIVIPVCWFEKDGQYYAQCWDIRVVRDAQGELIWQAIMPSDPLKPRIVCTNNLLKPMSDLAADIQAHPQDYIKVYYALLSVLRVSGKLLIGFPLLASY